MSVSTIGNPIMNWSHVPNIAECGFPWGDYCHLVGMASPCGKRKFLVMNVDCDPDTLTGNWVAVEVAGRCPYLAQLERGGGITWSEYFLRFDRLLLFTIAVFGVASSKLVDSKPYERKIRRFLDSLGNQSAWDMYSRHAYGMLEYGRQNEDDEEIQARVAETWQTYVLRYNLRFPDKKIAA
jgi:hypothetical protein